MEFKKVLLFITVLLYITILLLVSIPKTEAQGLPCGTTGQPKAKGLVSTPQITGTFSIDPTTGACVVDPKAAFAPLALPTFDSLKSLYFDQYKGPITDKQEHTGTTGETSLGGYLCSFPPKKLIYINGNLEMDHNVPGCNTNTAVVFVAGNLILAPDTTPLMTQFTYGDGNSGLVFIVKGSVYIHRDLTRVDGIIMSGGTICTAADFDTVTRIASCPPTLVTTPQLVVNGSLISLNPIFPIQFKRTLSGALNATQPAEKIVHQPKYLVILRDLLSDTYQKWTEIAE